MKFNYFKFPLPTHSPLFGTTLLKPIIPVTISTKNDVLNYAALVDSGADFCIFDAEIGEALGLDVRSGTIMTFGGIQEHGQSQAFLHEVSLSIGGWQHKATVGFSYHIAAYGYGVLGQKGFFDIFTVKFDLFKEEMELKTRNS